MSTFLLNKKYLPHRVGVCFIIGIIAGLFFHDFSIWVKPAGDLFMNMIKMIIVPLVFSSLVIGVCSLGDIKKIGRIGGKTMAYYLGTTAFAIVLGIF